MMRLTVSEIIGGSDDQTIRFADSVKDRCQAIPADAAAFEFFFLASEAGDTSCVSLKAEEIKLLHLGTDRLCSSDSFCDQCICVPALPGSRIDGDDFLLISLSINFNLCCYFFCISVSSLRRYLRKDPVRLIIFRSRLFFSSFISLNWFSTCWRTALMRPRRIR